MSVKFSLFRILILFLFDDSNFDCDSRFELMTNYTRLLSLQQSRKKVKKLYTISNNYDLFAAHLTFFNDSDIDLEP